MKTFVALAAACLSVSLFAFPAAAQTTHKHHVKRHAKHHVQAATSSHHAMARRVSASTTNRMHRSPEMVHNGYANRTKPKDDPDRASRDANHYANGASKNVNHELNRESKDVNHTVNNVSKSVNHAFQGKKKQP